MNVYPLMRRCSSVAGTCSGATSSVDLSRKNTVPSTACSPPASRSSCAISSRPVASGTLALGAAGHVDGGRVLDVAEDLLRADRAVAGAPRLGGVLEDHLA